MYFLIENNKLIGVQNLPVADEQVSMIIATKTQTANIKMYGEDYYTYKNGKIVENKDYYNNKIKELQKELLMQALKKADEYVNSGELCYKLYPDVSIEATDGNIGKLTAYTLGLKTGAIDKIIWTTKEDMVIELNEEEASRALVGIGAKQSSVWNIQYIDYKNQIESATTLDELNSISIEYV